MAGTVKRISDDLKGVSEGGTADTYSPDFYKSGLSFASNLILATDVNQDFIPLTSASRNKMLFVVGLIPPAADITGKLLDRSATLANIAGAPQEIDDKAPPQGKLPPVVSPSENGGVADTNKWQSYSDDFWIQFAAICSRLGMEPKDLATILQSESGFDTAAYAVRRGKIIAKGLNQLTHDTACGTGVPKGKPGYAPGLGMTEEEWAQYQDEGPEAQLPWVEKFFVNATGGKKGFTASDIYVVNFSPAAINHVKDPEYRIYSAPTKNYSDNIGFDYQPGGGRKGYITVADISRHATQSLNPAILAKVLQGKAALDSGVIPGGSAPAFTSDSSPSNYKAVGSDNAKAAAKEAQKNQGDTNRAELGKRFQAAQIAEIRATAEAIKKMRDTPPLRLLVNPSTFKIDSEKILNDGNWTRNGPIVEHWGDQQDKLTFSGKIAAFFAIDASSEEVGETPSNGAGQGNSNGAGPGLTRIARVYSQSYQNFLSLWLLYRSNAAVYLDAIDAVYSKAKGSIQPTWARLSMVGSMYIFYDGILYFGSFDSFNVTESDTAPFTLEYDISFTVRSTFILDQPEDPSRTYGAPAMFADKTYQLTTTQEQYATSAKLKSDTEAKNLADAKKIKDDNDAAIAKAAAEAAAKEAEANAKNALTQSATQRDQRGSRGGA